MVKDARVVHFPAMNLFTIWSMIMFGYVAYLIYKLYADYKKQEADDNAQDAYVARRRVARKQRRMRARRANCNKSTPRITAKDPESTTTTPESEEEDDEKPWVKLAHAYVAEVRAKAKVASDAAATKRRVDLIIKIVVALCFALNISGASGAVSTSLLYAALAAPAFWSTLTNPLYLTILSGTLTMIQDTTDYR